MVRIESVSWASRTSRQTRPAGFRRTQRWAAVVVLVTLWGCSSEAGDTAPTGPSSGVSTPTSVASPTVQTDSSASTVAAGAATTIAPDVSRCGLANAVFCDTFDRPAGNGGRTGDLDPVIWGVSRLGNVNPDHDFLNDIAVTSMSGCGNPDPSMAPSDVRICNGQLFESVNDGGGVANLNTYPKQPFDFKDRTGIVVFDVSADSDGSHGAWPEFVITDKPVPGARRSISFQVPPGAANSIGFSLDGGCGIDGLTGVGAIFVTKDDVYSEPTFTTPECITKGSAAAMNHLEVRLSQNRIEVWGTDAGATELKQLAVADDLGLTFTKGLVWLDDVHYNARKAIEPCQCGTQFDHTFVWDNLAFDGPKTYRDLGFDVPDANVEGGPSNEDDRTERIGYAVGKKPIDLQVEGVRSDQTPTGAQVVLNTYSYRPNIPSISINGGQWIDTPWPFDSQTYAWRSLSIPIPLEDVRDGSNTISVKSDDESTVITNISMILVAAGPVP